MKTTKCSVCNEDFPSRNKLFQHLESSGHGSRVSSVVKVASQFDGVDDINDSKQQPQLSKGNDAYYEYYRRQKICNTDNDEVWKEAYHKLRTPLPITYRIHESNPLSKFSVDLLSLMDKNEGEGNESQLNDWSFTKSNNKDDTSIPKLRMTITSNVHRSNKRSKDDLDKDKFSSVLHALQELGSIHRQELVSAIPPLVLWSAGSTSGDSGPIVADMCAA